MREELERRAQEIKGKLKPWRGLTIREAREKGWGEQEDRLQIELWAIGFQLNRLRTQFFF